VLNIVFRYYYGFLRKSDDLNTFAAHNNEISSTISGKSSVITYHYQNILNNRKSVQEFTKIIFGDGIRALPAQKWTVTRL